MLNTALKAIFGSRNDRLLKQYRKTVDAINALEPRFEKMSDSDRPVFDTKEHYNQETLNIVTDYLGMLGQRKLAVAR